jgi:glycosyltransferase involved in cell wall biosynthesis
MSMFGNNSQFAQRERRLGVIQPHLSNASQQMFVELSQYCPLDLLVSPPPAGAGFGGALPSASPQIRCFVIPTFKPFGPSFGWVQWGVTKHILTQRPHTIFINANPRYFSFWTTLLWARLLRIPVYAHGHGFYRRSRISTLYKIMMSVLLNYVTAYICYAPIVRQAFIDNGFSPDKLAVAHNSLTNAFPVRPEEKTGREQGILFIGRLRAGSNIETLIEVIERIREEDHLPLLLHVIGAGEKAESLRANALHRPWIVMHGEVYDADKIREISLNCFLGCYPGNAGLSVIHMMSLSLPVVTHDDLRAHGPEPSFIRNGQNGLLYDHGKPEESLGHAIRSLACDRSTLSRMSRSAFAEYQHLSNPSLARRFWMIIRNEQNTVVRGCTRADPGTVEPSNR